LYQFPWHFPDPQSVHDEKDFDPLVASWRELKWGWLLEWRTLRMI
jgi:hypothetical protein